MSPESWKALFQTIQNRLPVLNVQDVASMASALARAPAPSVAKQQLFYLMADRLSAEACRLDGGALARAASGLTVSRVIPAKHIVYDALASAAKECTEDFNTDKMVQLLNAFAQVRLGGGRHGLLEHFAPHAIAWMPEFYPMELALLSNAYARVSVQSPALFEAIAQQLLLHHGKVDALRTVDVSIICNAYAKLSAPMASELMATLAEEVGKQINKMELQHIASVSWSFASIRHGLAPTLLQKLSNHVLANRMLEQFKAQELVNVLSAHAKARVRNPAWEAAVVQHLSQTPQAIDKMTTIDLLYTASSLAKLGCRNAKIYNDIGARMLNVLQDTPLQCSSSTFSSSKIGIQQLRPSQIIHLLHSYAQASCPHVGLFTAAVPSLRSTLRSLLEGSPLTARKANKGHNSGSTGRIPSRSDWVLAFSAYASTGLQTHSPQTAALCREMLRHCCQALMENGADPDNGNKDEESGNDNDDGYFSEEGEENKRKKQKQKRTAADPKGQLTAMDISELLRALTKVQLDDCSFAVGLLLENVVVRPNKFSDAELLVALLAGVQYREQSPHNIPAHLYNGLMSLVSEVLGSAQQGSLSFQDLRTAATVLAKTNHQEVQAWRLVSRRFTELMDLRLSAAGKTAATTTETAPAAAAAAAQPGMAETEQMIQCLAVLLNCFSRSAVQDKELLVAAYALLANPSLPLPPESSVAIALASLAKLGAAGSIDSARLGLPHQDVTRTWQRCARFSSSSSSTSSSFSCLSVSSSSSSGCVSFSPSSYSFVSSSSSAPTSPSGSMTKTWLQKQEQEQVEGALADLSIRLLGTSFAIAGTRKQQQQQQQCAISSSSLFLVLQEEVLECLNAMLPLLKGAIAELEPEVAGGHHNHQQEQQQQQQQRRRRSTTTKTRQTVSELWVGEELETKTEPKSQKEIETEVARRDSLVASCAQILSALQCLFLLRPTDDFDDNTIAATTPTTTTTTTTDMIALSSLDVLLVCRELLSLVELPLAARISHRSSFGESGLANEVIGALEDVVAQDLAVRGGGGHSRGSSSNCSSSSSGATEAPASLSLPSSPLLPLLSLFPRLRHEHPVAQYYVDLALLPPASAAK